jgi:hypothetical protein
MKGRGAVAVDGVSFFLNVEGSHRYVLLRGPCESHGVIFVNFSTAEPRIPRGSPDPEMEVLKVAQRDFTALDHDSFVHFDRARGESADAFRESVKAGKILLRECVPSPVLDVIRARFMKSELPADRLKMILEECLDECALNGCA